MSQAVLERGQPRNDKSPSLRARLRRISRKRARQVKDLALHLPGLLAGTGPVPRVFLRDPRHKELVHMALHLPWLIVLGARIRRAGFGHAARSEPVFVFKYLGQYLANSFGTAARLRIMSHHYRTLADCLPDLGKLGFPRDEIVLWSHRVELDTFTINLCMAENWHYLEGDLSLMFSVNGARLHRLTFTCIPGKEAGVEGGTALLVGGSQGSPGASGLIRHASRAMGEISPAAMLVLALQALAKRLGAGAILGVTANEQTSLRAYPEEAKLRYDEFWEVSGGERDGRFYRLPSGVVARDASHLSSAHRARARRKRERKDQILRQIRESVESLLLATIAVGAEFLAVGLQTVEHLGG